MCRRARQGQLERPKHQARVRQGCVQGSPYELKIRGYSDLRAPQRASLHRVQQRWLPRYRGRSEGCGVRAGSGHHASSSPLSGGDVERDAQQRQRWLSAYRRLVLWGRHLVKDGAEFKTMQVQCVQRAVCPNRHEDIRQV